MNNMDIYNTKILGIFDTIREYKVSKNCLKADA